MPPGWPIPPFDDAPKPHLLFLLTLPYSGSTAIAKLLESSDAITGLNHNCEGQWLIPGLCRTDRWDPALPVVPESIRAVWMNTFQLRRRQKPHARIVIEKSPPNMMRVDLLVELFGEASLLVNNRDPHAQCSSAFHRGNDPAKLDAAARDAAMAQLADLWLARSRRLMDLVETARLPRLSYEAFCADPSRLIEAFGLPGLGVTDVDPSASVRVKDYPARQVADQNTAQVARLTTRDVDVLNTHLSAEPELLDYFGYGLRDPVSRDPVGSRPPPTGRA